MGIRFFCPHCQGKLHVKSFLAGKQGICPHCEHSVRIPDASEEVPSHSSTMSAQPAAPTRSSDDATVPADRLNSARGGTNPTRPTAGERSAEAEVLWYVRGPDGGEYGPAEPTLMQQWVAEGRIGGSSLVWRTGWSNWQEAYIAFPELQPGLKPAHRSEPLAAGQDARHPASAATPQGGPGADEFSVSPPEHGSPTPSRETTIATEVGAAPPAAAPIITPHKEKPARGAGAATRADLRYRRRRGDRKGWWLMAVVLLALTSVALLVTLVVVLMNQTS